MAARRNGPARVKETLARAGAAAATSNGSSGSSYLKPGDPSRRGTRMNAPCATTAPQAAFVNPVPALRDPVRAATINGATYTSGGTISRSRVFTS